MQLGRVFVLSRVFVHRMADGLETVWWGGSQALPPPWWSPFRRRRDPFPLFANNTRLPPPRDIGVTPHSVSRVLHKLCVENWNAEMPKAWVVWACRNEKVRKFETAVSEIHLEFAELSKGSASAPA